MVKRKKKKLRSASLSVLNKLFKTGDEKYLTILVSLSGKTIARLIMCSDWLCERANLWQFAKEQLIDDDSDINMSFSVLNKQNCMIYLSSDSLLNSPPAFPFIYIHNSREFENSIDMVRSFYDEVKQVPTATTPEKDDHGQDIDMMYS